MTVDKKLCEDYKKRKANEFKKDLDVLLDKYDFSGYHRTKITEECMGVVEEQIGNRLTKHIHEQMRLDLKEKKKMV